MHIFNRRSLAGLMILIMIMLSILKGLIDFPGENIVAGLAGISGWIAGIFVFIDAPRTLKIQASILILMGVILSTFALTRGQIPDWFLLTTLNTSLLSMIAAVGFLRLVVLPRGDEVSNLPRGPAAFFRTMLGLSFSSSITNISAPVMVCDRIHETRPINRYMASCSTRVFCGAASWSPFYGAMAVVLTYSPDADLLWLIFAGMPLCIAGLVYIFFTAWRFHTKELPNFVGYPLHGRDLTIPLTLIGVSLFGYFLLKGSSILAIIASCALLVTVSTLILRYGFSSAISQLGEFVVEGLPKIVNELTLFLSAGVLAVGIIALIEVDLIQFQIMNYSTVTTVSVLAGMVLLSMLGIHPVIQIASFAPILLESSPSANLIGATWLFAWNLGTCSSYLSGTNLIFQGRYGIPSWRIAVDNWPYALSMVMIGSIWLWTLNRYFSAFQ
ncbi:MAG: hypothetical protein OXE41_07740 [Gammaproteobacteria bacterium]|nr:hypothetical protein [Gammaproteobacteria bacterium]MCY4275268.1 hypothetical protein [Gammaproteobacteria bacterium]